jgi:putative transposase
VPDPEELALMRWFGEQHLATPFSCSRRMAAELGKVQRINAPDGVSKALGPKPNTSRPSAQHRVYPTCCDLTIDRPNQV